MLSQNVSCRVESRNIGLSLRVTRVGFVGAALSDIRNAEISGWEMGIVGENGNGKSYIDLKTHSHSSDRRVAQQ
jgi:hypothetical protein